MRPTWSFLVTVASVVAGGLAMANFSTPEGALQSLEDAYARKDIEGAVAAKDFRVEAREMLAASARKNRWKDPPDEALIKKAAEVLELGFRKEIEARGFPDLAGVKCSVVEKQMLRDDLARLVENCVRPDGTRSRDVLFAARTTAGWRIVNLPKDRDP